jgi:RND superfamily putative drug exporter
LVGYLIVPPTDRSVGIAGLVISRPLLVLAVWLTVIGGLALKGIGVEDRLHRSSLSVSGGAERANQLGTDHFGSFASLTLLLEGPRGELDAQGRRLVARIDRLEGAKVLSPWTTTGNGATLRPRRDRALLVVRTERDFEEISRETTPALRALLERHVTAPVRAHMTGAPDVANGIHGGSLDALARAEVIAAPVLLLVLLLVFRSPVAAAIPLMLGLMTIGATRGAIDLLNGVVPLDALALSIGSMIGLALGVDYSLLVVSRFREELAAGADTRRAATIATQTAGRTVIFAGVALLAAGVASTALAPGSLLVSAGVGLMTAATLSVAGAIAALPAALALRGEWVDRWRFGAAEGQRGTAGVALATLRRPAAAAALVTALMVLLAAPATALDTGPPSPLQMPSSSVEYRDYEAIRKALGPGWMAPYDIVVATERGTITEPRRLRALDQLQARLARDEGVAAVFGPAPLARAARRLEAVPATLRRARRQLGRGLRDQGRLASAMRQVGAGVGKLRAGLAAASDGAGALAGGGARAGDGAGSLAAGLAEAKEGAAQMAAGLDRGETGARSLARGVRAALTGSRRLAGGVDALRAGVREGAPGVGRLAAGLREGADGLERLREPAQLSATELANALAALDRMLPTSKADPQYRRVYESVGRASAALTGRDPRDGSAVRPGYDGIDAALATAAGRLREGVAGVDRLAAELARMADGLRRLDRSAGALTTGLRRLRAGADRLTAGLGELDDGGSSLSAGLARLRAGARELDAGTGRLAAGATRLHSGLRSGSQRSVTLHDGVKRITAGVVAGQVRTRRLGSGLRGGEQLGRAARSGHLLLATVDAAPPRQREPASFVVNLDRGGSAADITVVPVGDATQAGAPLRARLDREAAAFSERTGLDARVGGAGPVFQDFDARTSERLPYLVAALVLLTYLVLVPIFRSLLLPAIALLLNVITILAAFGVLALLFQDSSPLGGPGYVDAIITMGVVGIVFGLSIDYAVFLVSRMREGYTLTGTTNAAIEYGLRGTARIVTGAALIMSAAFASLAISGMSTLRQFGVGLTVAVLLDATIVRLVLLPALIKLAGPAAWWFPSWLERRPRDGDPARGAGAGASQASTVSLS